MHPRAQLRTACLVGLAAPAFAQTCNSPQTIQVPNPSGTSLLFDTCTGDDSASPLLCGGVHDRRGPLYVLRANFAAGRTFTQISLGGGSATFNPVMYVTSTNGGCGANQETCFPSGDTGFPLMSADIPDGDWLIVVTAADIDGAGSCGTATITTDGVLPVTMTHFSID